MKYLLSILLVFIASSAFAGEITIDDSYARVSRPGAPTGAAFMVIRNSGDEADTLIAAASPAAKRVELHTHIERDGVMMMRPVENGIEIAAGSEHMLMRGGDHVMMMGLTVPLVDGDTVEVTLTFEKAGEIEVTVPVDNARGQSGHNH